MQGLTFWSEELAKQRGNTDANPITLTASNAGTSKSGIFSLENCDGTIEPMSWKLLREERKAFFQYRPGLDYRRSECKEGSRVKQSTGENRAT